VRFLADAQLPPALAALLGQRGHNAEHITDIGPADTPDRELWRHALEFRAVIVTKDEEIAHMIATGVDAPHVVRIRVGNTRRASLLSWFEQIATMVEAGERLIELR
jgi:predicted nuclease of predicted toxin-antitoxin system